MVHHIFDSHAHYDDERFCEDRGELLSSFPAVGVCRVLNAGCNLEASRAASPWERNTLSSIRQ